MTKQSVADDVTGRKLAPHINTPFQMVFSYCVLHLLLVDGDRSLPTIIRHRLMGHNRTIVYTMVQRCDIPTHSFMSPLSKVTLLLQTMETKTFLICHTTLAQNIMSLPNMTECGGGVGCSSTCQRKDNIQKVDSQAQTFWNKDIQTMWHST
jgi:hypothetical protein